MGWSIDKTGNFSTVWWVMAAGPLLAVLLMLPVDSESTNN
jgi:hypothetical protein